MNALNLPAAQRLIGKNGAFEGRLDRIYQAPDNSIKLLNFHPNYRSALVVAIKPANWDKFSALDKLVGQRLLIEGNFFVYQAKSGPVTEVEITSPSQIKIVE